VVVFPDPFGPRNPKSPPLLIESVRSSTSFLVLNGALDLNPRLILRHCGQKSRSGRLLQTRGRFSLLKVLSGPVRGILLKTLSVMIMMSDSTIWTTIGKYPKCIKTQTQEAALSERVVLDIENALHTL
jgi:hypothetical protein